jgi:hypothetical protein
MIVTSLSSRTEQRLRFSPAGELLPFAWPKESNQRKGHPWCVGLRLPCDARRPRRRWNSPWRAAQIAAHCGARTPSPFFPRAAALLGGTQGEPARAPGVSSPSALPIWRAWTGHTIFHGLQPVESRSPLVGKKRNPVRAPQQGTFRVPCQGEWVERPAARVKSGTRRAAMWGRLSLVPFFGETKKGTRPKAKRGRSSASRLDSESGRQT